MGNCLKPKQQNVQTPSQSKVVKVPEEKGLSLIMKCWKQTHNNLFNFNLLDSQLTTQIISIMLRKVRIIKLGDQYQALFPKDPQFSKLMPPIMIDVTQLKDKDRYGQKKYSFLINEFPKISKPFWLVVKSLPSQRYHLKQGDIFKLGKIKLRVKQIIHKNSQTKDMSKEILQAEYKVYNCQGNQCFGQKQTQSLKQSKCRICMEDGQKTNPLIAICDCIGSSKYIHFKCLKQWLTTQLDPTKINMVTQISWKTLQCQLCKARLPYSINLDNQNYFLVNFPKIKKPYLVLNPVYKSNNEKSKIYYFISFKKRNRMTIGRKSDADIQVCTDATISRYHSIIEYVQKNPNEDGKYYLQDNRSKFGTVVLLNTKNPIVIDAKMHGVQFQVGGDLVKVSYKTQNFFQTMSTKQDEVDFNTGENNLEAMNIREFESQQQDQIRPKIILETDSNEYQNRASKKQGYNHMENSSDHQHTNQILLSTTLKKLEQQDCKKLILPQKGVLDVKDFLDVKGFLDMLNKKLTFLLES